MAQRTERRCALSYLPLRLAISNVAWTMTKDGLGSSVVLQKCLVVRAEGGEGTWQRGAMEGKIVII